MYLEQRGLCRKAVQVSLLATWPLRLSWRTQAYYNNSNEFGGCNCSGLSTQIRQTMEQQHFKSYLETLNLGPPANSNLIEIFNLGAGSRSTKYICFPSWGCSLAREFWVGPFWVSKGLVYNFQLKCHNLKMGWSQALPLDLGLFANSLGLQIECQMQFMA